MKYKVYIYVIYIVYNDDRKLSLVPYILSIIVYNLYHCKNNILYTYGRCYIYPLPIGDVIFSIMGVFSLCSEQCI
jgi:hypothetical protein